MKDDLHVTHSTRSTGIHPKINKYGTGMFIKISLSVFKWLLNSMSFRVWIIGSRLVQTCTTVTDGFCHHIRFCNGRSNNLGYHTANASKRTDRVSQLHPSILQLRINYGFTCWITTWKCLWVTYQKQWFIFSYSNKVKLYLCLRYHATTAQEG
jgi:hypothetical protein